VVAGRRGAVYVLLPVLAVTLAAVAGRSVSRAIGVVLGLTLALWLLRVATVTSVEPSALWRYSLPAKACFFGPGLLLALLRVRWESGPPGSTTRSRLAEPAVWITGAGLLTALAFWRYTWDGLLLPACFMLLGVAVLPLRSERGLGWLGWRPLGVLGPTSYSSTCGMSRSSGCWHRPPGCRTGSGCSCSRAASRRSCSRW
jgi:peptidoglycan/LPS O-acetylase OafA/YrhL